MNMKSKVVAGSAAVVGTVALVTGSIFGVKKHKEKKKLTKIESKETADSSNDEEKIEFRKILDN